MRFDWITGDGKTVTQDTRDTWSPAEKLAYEYNYNADALYAEYNRRSFGSFALGREDERDLFFKAWRIAFDRKGRTQ